MLTSLHIENFAIVSQLDLTFTDGMTAFTGETGAGKSIMIDALMLALGGRADASVIRHGALKCDVSACFHIDVGSAPSQWLLEQDLSHEDGEVILRRVLYAEGRSKSYVNGQPFSLQKIKELSELLVDIHGQHQHQRLLQHAVHRQQLDHYAGHAHLLEAVQSAYSVCQHLQQQLKKCHEQGVASERMALLHYQLEELAALALQDGEMQALHEEHQLLHHACDYLAQAQQIATLLSDGEAFTICHGLHQITQLLESLPQEQSAIKTTIELINTALIQCEEALDEMKRFADHVQLDPERLSAVEARISALHQAARKYKVDAGQLPEQARLLHAEYEQLKHAALDSQALQADYDRAVRAYHAAAIALRASRQEHALLLANEISQSIQQLGMPKGFVQVALTPLEKMHAHGLDKVEYLVCTNPGMSVDTLAKVASGGELSRISLAIQMITAQRGSTPTLLFDEVDVGIGGATAALVGKLLRHLGARLQVFCVTHQPQVAACAHQHFVVEKYSDKDQTFSTIIALDGVHKVDEIARMLGGLTVTEQTRSHAKELLGNSQ